MRNRIHILGASGSGVSTLGSELDLRLPHVNLDGDDYFWTEKFSRQREPADRVRFLKEDLREIIQFRNG